MNNIHQNIYIKDSGLSAKYATNHTEVSETHQGRLLKTASIFSNTSQKCSREKLYSRKLFNKHLNKKTTHISNKFSQNVGKLKKPNNIFSQDISFDSFCDSNDINKKQNKNERFRSNRNSDLSRKRYPKFLINNLDYYSSYNSSTSPNINRLVKNSSSINTSNSPIATNRTINYASRNVSRSPLPRIKLNASKPSPSPSPFKIINRTYMVHKDNGGDGIKYNSYNELVKKNPSLFKSKKSINQNENKPLSSYQTLRKYEIPIIHKKIPIKKSIKESFSKTTQTSKIIETIKERLTPNEKINNFVQKEDKNIQTSIIKIKNDHKNDNNKKKIPEQISLELTKSIHLQDNYKDKVSNSKQYLNDLKKLMVNNPDMFDSIAISDVEELEKEYQANKILMQDLNLT